MVQRKSAQQVAQETGTQKYFAKDWGFKTKTNFGIGSEVYVIPLDIQNGIFTELYHEVQPKGKNNGLRGNFATPIKCTKESGECKACNLAKIMYEKYPSGTGNEEKDLANIKKRMISSSRERVWIPVMILGNSETDPNKKQISPNKVSLRTYDFSFLEMSNKQYKEDLFGVLANKLKDDGVIEYDLSDEEVNEAVQKALSKTVIRVRGVESSFKGRAKKEYSFVPFSMKALGASTGEHDAIANYMDNTTINNAVVDFLTLFTSEVDKLIYSIPYEEVERWVLGASEQQENMEAFKQATAEEEQAQLAQEPAYTEEAFKEEVSAVEEALTDEDITFDTDEEFDFDESFAEV